MLANRKRATSRRRRPTSLHSSRCGLGGRSRPLRCEPLEERRLLSVTPFEGFNLFTPLSSTTTYLMDNDGSFAHHDVEVPDLAGLELVETDGLNWQGQVVYLDFDGQQGVMYEGPVCVEGIDVSAFVAEATFSHR